MYAYVKIADGQFYMSAVFGFYENENKEYAKNYWIVLNKEKTRLIKHFTVNPDSKYIELMLCHVDWDETNWGEKSPNGIQCVNYLPAEKISEMIDTDSVPADLLERCIAEDSAFVFNPYPEIQTQKDLETLAWTAGGLHDAQIAEEKLGSDGVLYVRFEGAWACNVEMWFWGDLQYDTASRDPAHYDPYWQDSTMLLHNGFVYLADDYNLTAEEIENGGYCCFKARHMKYHLIPV